MSVRLIGALSQGQVIAFINYLNQILLAMIAAANLVVIFTERPLPASASKRYSIPSPRSYPLCFSNGCVNASAPRVAFDHVSFAYAGAESPCYRTSVLPPLQDRLIGIIGTGAGKSTFASSSPFL